MTGFCSHLSRYFYSTRSQANKLCKQGKQRIQKPVWNNTELSDKVVGKYFESRGISQFVVRQLQVTEGMEFMPQIGKEGKHHSV